MPTTEDLDRLVRARLESSYPETDRELATKTLPQFNAELTEAGASQSSWAERGEIEHRANAVSKKIKIRAAAELEAHRRGASSITVDRANSTISDLDRVIEHDMGLYRGIRGRLAPAGLKEAIERLGAEARSRIQEVAADSALPPIDDVSRSSFVINVHAPNHGVIASRIAEVFQEQHGSDAAAALRDVLVEILDASRDLPDAAAAEVREVVDGLVVEVERQDKNNPSLVRTSVRQLVRLFEGIDSFARIVALLEKVPALLKLISAAGRSM